MSSPSPTTELRPPACSSQSETEILVRVEGVSKIFCRDLKKSLFYGLKDSVRDLAAWGIKHEASGTKHKELALRPGEFLAVDNVNFELRRGECLGLIGHNGAGKTTLLKMLNGLIKPDSGRIEMRGRIGALIALGAGFNPILSGRENVYVNGSILGLSRDEIDEKMDEIVEFAEIREFIDSPVMNYSSGMVVRLGFAVASALKPDVLILDEVLAVGDVGFQAKCFNRLAELRMAGVPFILVSHNMHQISRYCHKVLFMKHGKVEFLGAAEEGISRFLEDMKAPADCPSAGPDWSVVLGTGKVVLTSAEFLDAVGNPTNVIRAGTPVTLAVSFKCQDEPVVDPVFDVIVRCRGEIIFQSTNRANSMPMGQLPTLGKLMVEFDEMPMNTGPLDFNFCLLDGKTNELFDWKRDLRLELKPDASQSGTLFLKTQWKVKDSQPL